MATFYSEYKESGNLLLTFSPYLLVRSYRSQFHLSVLFIMHIECAVIHLVMIFRPCILVSKLLWFYVPKGRQRRDASCQVNFLYMLVGSIRSEIILSFSTSFFSFPLCRSWSAFRQNRHESDRGHGLAPSTCAHSDLELSFSISSLVVIYSFLF